MDYRGNKMNGGRNRLSDRDMLFDILMTGKQMSHLYDHAIMESTNDNIRDAFIALQQDEHESTHRVFEFMQQQGWYTTGANRQNLGRRLGRNQQQLSGGTMTPRVDSRYAVASGSRRFGGRLNEQQERGHANMRPPQGSKPGLFNARSDWNV